MTVTTSYILIYTDLVTKPWFCGMSALAGLKLRAREGGVPPATMIVVPGYFHREIEENKTESNL